MNITFLIGFIVAFGGIVAGFMLEGGKLAALWQLSAFCIIFGGTIGIAFIAFPLDYIRKIPAALKVIIRRKKYDYPKAIELLCGIANKARKDGIISLESEADNMKDPFIRKGLLYISDGVDPDALKKLMENEIESHAKRYEDAAAVFEGMGGTAPTMGVLGTVMGMVTTLANMSSDVAHIGEKIAVAFIATLYGIGSANLIWLPIGGQIKNVTEQETYYKEFLLEGMLAIVSGESSTRMKDRLTAMLEKPLADSGNSAGAGD